MINRMYHRLPLDPVLLAISELLPKVQELQPATTPGPSRNVINYLRSATLVDVLPPHPAHNPRHFHVSSLNILRPGGRPNL